MKKIQILFPTRNRPYRFKRVLFEYCRLLSCPDTVKFTVNCDADDVTMDNEDIREWVSKIPTESHIQLCYDPNHTKIEAYNRNVDTSYDIIMVIADDTYPIVHGYDEIITESFELNFPDNDGILWFNDGHKGNGLNTLPILGNKFYDRFGYIFHPSYKSLCCDREFMKVGEILGRQKYIDQVIIEHRHYAFGLSEKDDLDNINESYYMADKQTYRERSRINFGIETV